MTGSGYRSRFEHWDTQAWVRSKPRRDAPFRPGLHFFSPDLCLPLRHGDVAAEPDTVRERILVHHLYLFLEFTVRLETGPVNDACLLLRSPDFLPWLPPGMRDDALRIYTDEAGHAEMSHTLMAAVATHTGVAPLPHEPAFLRALAEILAAEPDLDPTLLRLFFVIVSETLITASLTRLPRDPLVQGPVRELAADHAADEGKHHAYFRQLFEYLWPRLPAPTRRRIGTLLPHMMLAYLCPDEPALAAVLADCGLPEAERVAAEVVAAPHTRADIRDAAAPTLRMLAANGVLADPLITAAFAEADLVAAGA